MAHFDGFLRDKLKSYPNSSQAIKDAKVALEQYGHLKPLVKKFAYPDGISKDLVCLEGTIPVNYRGSLYNIPVCIWLQERHPYIPPLCYVIPTAEMEIRAGRHVDTSGRVHVPFLTDWKHPQSDLYGLIQVLCFIFAEQPPVFARTSGMPQAMEEKRKRQTPSIIVHGGAWSIPFHLIEHYREGVQQAVKVGYDVLKKGGTAVEAVEKAVCYLEDNSNFNAGHGAVLNEHGKVECDAMIMDGTTMNTGAVMAVRHFSNPVSLSRRVMEETPHCALNTEGALAFARKSGFPILEDPMELVSEHAKAKGSAFSIYENAVHFHIEGRSTEECHDTVGAVAMDTHGRLACATSTGGIPAKMEGRIGDSAMVGCGGYANEYGASSTTGHGESLMKMTLAREAIYNIERGDNAQVSAEKAIARMKKRIDGYGGVIVIDKDGNFGRAFNTKRMAWATMKDDILEYGLDPNECITVDIK